MRFNLQEKYIEACDQVLRLAQTLKERDAEIERLKSQFQKANEWNQFSEIQIKNLQNMVEAQSDLLTRAADALESPAWEWHKSWALAKELRKAAK
jgi:regulator of replication initiation timing